MRKTLLVFAALFLTLPLYTQSFKEQLSKNIAPVSDKYLTKTYGFTPSWQLPQEPSVWDSFTSLFTSQEKEEKQQALAQYIYNMYIIEAAKGTNAAYLDTSYTGALDPIYRSAFKNAAELEKFFNDNQQQINSLLKEYFAKNLKLVYNDTDKHNKQTSWKYIQILSATYNENKKFSYMPGTGGLNNTQLDKARKAQLSAMIKDNKATNDNLAVIYENTDPFDMLDNATRTGAHNFAKQYTYRPLKEECSACSYTFCKDICAVAKDRYGQYQILRLYQVYAYPKSGYLKDKQGKDRFANSTGDLYPQWDYHSASLLIFVQNGGLNFTVIDNFLTDGPVQFEDWINLFDKDNTFFTLLPFSRNAATEKSIKNISDIPPSYKPHPVRK